MSTNEQANRLAVLLRRATDERQMSIGDIARRTGLSRSGLWKLLNPDWPEPPEPRLSTLHLLSEVLDIPLADLIEACGYSVEPAA